MGGRREGGLGEGGGTVSHKQAPLMPPSNLQAGHISGRCCAESSEDVEVQGEGKEPVCEYLLCARQCRRDPSEGVLLKHRNNPMKQVGVFIPTLQVWKLRPREFM